MFSAIFAAKPQSDEEARQLVENTRAIAREFTSQIHPGRNLKQFLQSFGGQPKSNYSHVVNCAAYSVVFGAILGVEDLESLGLGALLHDVGLSVLPFVVAVKPEGELSPEELSEYRIHPYYSMDVLTKRRMPMSASVQKMILHHHELPDGSGFPNGLKSHEIHPFAKILAFADAFDDLTRVTMGQPVCSPAKAIEIISGVGSATSAAKAPPMPFFEEAIHGPICKALLGGAVFAGTEPNQTVVEQLKNHSDAPESKPQGDSGAEVVVNPDLDHQNRAA